MKYLIMQCEELENQWECDADRTPMFITDDWKNNIPDYSFEVWEILEDGIIGEIVKRYNEPMEEGMAFGYWDGITEEFHLIQKFPNRTRKDYCSNDIYDKLMSINEMCDNLKNEGFISAYSSKEDREYIYGEYADSDMPQSY